MKKIYCLCGLFLWIPALLWGQNYYSSVDNTQGGAPLKTALYNLLREHTRISYGNDTWSAFALTDVVAGTDKQVADMYSSTVRYYGNNGSAVSGMNIEHSLPKSWWGGTKNDAYCDLHHLNPADQKANSAKSNYPLGEVSSKVNFDNGISKTGKSSGETGGASYVYEPADEYKGDFARAYFYMATCYQNLTWKYTYMFDENSTYPTLNEWSVELLLKWHRQDPVSIKEVTRNQEVYKIQKNRNPYIDYPQMAEYVWGDSVASVFRLNGDPAMGDTTQIDRLVEISSAAGAVDGTRCHVKGTVAAVCSKSFLLSDRSGSILVYLNTLPAYGVGDIVTVVGAVSAYGGLNQFTNTAVITKVDVDAGFEQPEPEIVSGTDLDDYLDNISVRYVTYTGVLRHSGDYCNVMVDGAETAVCSLFYPAEDLTELEGDTVQVTGYIVGVSGSVYVNTLLTDIIKKSADNKPDAGTEENPYTVEDVESLNGSVTTPVWVLGQVGGTYLFGGSLTTEEWTINSNIALINADASVIVPVQLPSGRVRENLNLVAHPELKGSTVKVCGNLRSYFSVPGVKSVSDYRIINGSSVERTDREGCFRVDGNRIVVSGGNAIEIFDLSGRLFSSPVNETVVMPAGLFIVKQGTQRWKVRIGK